MNTIHRQAELRAEGRRLSGTVISWGDQSDYHGERFEPGSVRIPGAVTLNLRHRTLETVAYHPDGGLSLMENDHGITMSAELPPTPAGDLAFQEVRAGRLPGLSVEFFSEAERRDADIRVIERARLVGIGLVSSPSYPGSRVEARAATTTIPFGRPLPCDCGGKNTGIVMIENVEIAKTKGGIDRDVLAVAGKFDTAMGSLSRGSLILTPSAAGLAISLSDDALNTPAGRDLVEQAEAVPIYARPIFDQEQSESEDKDGVTVYSKMALRAILFKPVDDPGDWPEVSFTDRPRRHNRSAETHPRGAGLRIPLWL